MILSTNRADLRTDLPLFHICGGLPWWLRRYRICPQCQRPGFDPWVDRSPGGGHGSPLQCSCLDGPHGWRSWRAAVRGAAKSQAWLKWFSTACAPLLLAFSSSCPGAQSSRGRNRGGSGVTDLHPLLCRSSMEPGRGQAPSPRLSGWRLKPERSHACLSEGRCAVNWTRLHN